MDKNYEVLIVATSREFTAKERIQIKDTSDAVKLDKATQDDAVIIEVADYAVLDIHNENAEDKDYTQFVIIDADGTRYVTGSDSFWNSFSNIYSEMQNETDDWKLKIYRMPSKKREGKDFITCSII